jgi:hypothetical protein
MLRGQGYGRTRSEAIQYFSDLQDMEDRRAEVREVKEFENWKIQRSASLSGDTTAPTEQELAARARSEEREREGRMNASVRQYVKRETVREARKVALADTSKLVGGLAQAVANDYRRAGY